MDVMIGIDPHKRSHTATMLDRRQRELRQITVRSGSRQLVELLAWANGARRRTWAVECASGLGYLLAQQLVAARRDGGRCARHVGVAGAGAGHRSVDQDRSQRRPLGGAGCVARAVADRGAPG